MSSPSSTSRPVHPTARAFFDALAQQGASSLYNTSSSSELIRKKSQTLGWRNRHSQADRYPVTLMVNGEAKTFSVKQVQRGELEGNYGTGATVWPASMVLLKYLERHSSLVCDKSVIDLGAGTGIISIGAALLGAKRVVCTDGSEKVVQLAKENVLHARQELRDVSSDEESSRDTEPSSTTIGNCNVQVQEYYWGDGSIKERFDVILVSDCVLPKLYPIEPLVDALDELFDIDSVAILSYEHRYYPDYDPRIHFRNLVEAKEMELSVVPLEQQHFIYSVDDIEVWEVRRKR